MILAKFEYEPNQYILEIKSEIGNFIDKLKVSVIYFCFYLLFVFFQM